MAQDSIPPLRIRENDGSPNVIPVFDIILSSNLTLLNKGGGIVSISATTGAGGTAQDPITFPLIVGSGGTGDTTLTNRGILIGSGANPVQILAALNSGELVVGSSTVVAPQILPLSAGSQGFVLTTNSASQYGVSWVSTGNLGSSSSVAYARTGNTYVVVTLTDDLSAERSATQGMGIVILDSGANSNLVWNADTALLVTSGRSISTIYPISGGGNLSLNRTFAVDTAFLVTSAITINTGPGITPGGNLGANVTVGINTGGSSVGQVLISSAGTSLGGVAWVNTLGGASSSVYAATGNNYVVMNLAGDLTNEYRLVQSGNSITITTDTTTITINAVTGGLTQIISIPMALLSVEVNSGNAFWIAQTDTTRMDKAYINMTDSGRSISTWWVYVPKNTNATPAWGIDILSEAATLAATGGLMVLNVDAMSVLQGSSANTLAASTTQLISAGSFGINTAGILSLTTMTTTNFDSALTTSAGHYLKVKIARQGNVDTFNSDWYIYSVLFNVTVNT